MYIIYFILKLLFKKINTCLFQYYSSQLNKKYFISVLFLQMENDPNFFNDR